MSKEQVVYDIQRPQGSPQHTVDPAPTDLTPMIRGAGAAIGDATDFYGRVSKASGSKKDYAPLVRALEKYKDTVQSSKMLQAQQEILWNDLVEWAGGQGYTHGDIDGFAKTTNAEIPNKSLTEYVKTKQSPIDAEQRALQERATKFYPSLPADEALAQYTSLLTKEVLASDFGKASQIFAGADLANLEEASIGTLQNLFSQAISIERTRIGAAFSTDDLMEIIHSKGSQLIENGFSPELIGYLEDSMYNLWESSAKRGAEATKSVSESLQSKENIEKHEMNMKEIQNGLLMANEKNRYLNMVFDTPKGSMTGAQIQIVCDTSDTACQVLMGSLDKNKKAFSQVYVDSLMNIGGYPKEEQSSMSDKLFMKREYALLADSSPNKETRSNAAATQVNAIDSWIDRERSNMQLNPNSKMSDLLRMFNSRIILDKEDYTTTPDRVQINKDFTSKLMSIGAAIVGNEMNNSLPLFNKQGELRMYKVDGLSPAMLTSAGPSRSFGAINSYFSEDITEGYSMFGDRNVFAEEYATGLPMFIQKVSEITNTNVKDVKDLYNTIMIANSDVGKRIAAGQDTRGRFISTESPINISSALSRDKASQILDNILKGGEFTISAEAPKEQPKQQKPAYSVTEENFKVMDNADIKYQDNGFVDVKGTPNGDIKAPADGTVEYSEGNDKGNYSILIREQDRSLWAIQGAGLTNLPALNSTVKQGEKIANAGKTGEILIAKYRPDRLGFGRDSKVLP